MPLTQENKTTILMLLTIPIAIFLVDAIINPKEKTNDTETRTWENPFDEI